MQDDRPRSALDDEFDLIEIIRTLWRNKLKIVLSALLSALLGLFYAFYVAEPEYRAIATVDIQTSRLSAIGGNLYNENEAATQLKINTEVQRIQSRAILGALVDRMQLITDPEFNKALAPGFIARLRGPAERTEQEARQDTISALAEAVDVVNPKQSSIVQISAASRSAEKSSQLTNALSAIYLVDQSKQFYDETQSTPDWMAERYADIKALLATEQAQADQDGKLELAERAANSAAAIYSHFLSEVEARLGAPSVVAIDGTVSKILSTATPPRGAVKPRKAMILVACTILGGLVAAGLLLVNQIANRTFHTAQDLENATGKSVWSVITKSRATRNGDVVASLKDPTVSDAMRSLRTSLLLSTIDQPAKVIAVAPASGRAKNNASALGLAESLTALGKRVLFIDANTRDSDTAAALGMQGQANILQVLSGEVSLVDAVAVPANLSSAVLLGETSSANAADIMSSERFRTLLSDARDAFDYVVLGSPSAVSTPEVRVMSQAADATVVVVKTGNTRERDLLAGLRKLEAADTKSVGLMLAP